MTESPQDPRNPLDPSANQQPQYGQQPYGQPQYGAPVDPAASGWTPTPAPGAQPRRGKVMLTTSAAVVVLAVGGVATYAAVSSSDSGGGASTPKAAVQSALTDLNNSDLLGLLDDLAPGERTALVGPVGDIVDELKRSDVLSRGADAGHVSGIDVQASKFVYSPSTVTINDHVQIVQITAGTLRVNGDASKLPLSKDFLDAVVPGGLHSAKTETVDIATELRKSGDKAVRIAAQKVGGRWYPSLGYTIADYALDQRVPTAADAIPATGASSAGGAVTSLLTALLRGDVDAAVGVLSPDELGVLHDYGHLALPRSFDSPFGDAALSNVTTTSRTRSDGTDLVTLTGATVSFHGRRITIASSGGCTTVTVSGSGRAPQKFCAGKTGGSSIAGLAESITGVRLTTRQITALNDLTSAAKDGGIIVSQRDGRWFVNPARTILTEAATLLGGLKSGDLLALVSIANR